jgi:hypothetical protein
MTPTEKLKAAQKISAALDIEVEGEDDPGGLGAQILILAIKARVPNFSASAFMDSALALQRSL